VLVGLLEQDDPSPSGTGRAASVVARLPADDAHPKTARRHAALKSGHKPNNPERSGAQLPEGGPRCRVRTLQTIGASGGSLPTERQAEGSQPCLLRNWCLCPKKGLHEVTLRTETRTPPNYST